MGMGSPRPAKGWPAPCGAAGLPGGLEATLFRRRCGRWEDSHYHDLLAGGPERGRQARRAGGSSAGCARPSFPSSAFPRPVTPSRTLPRPSRCGSGSSRPGACRAHARSPWDRLLPRREHPRGSLMRLRGPVVRLTDYQSAGPGSNHGLDSRRAAHPAVEKWVPGETWGKVNWGAPSFAFLCACVCLHTGWCDASSVVALRVCEVHACSSLSRFQLLPLASRQGEPCSSRAAPKSSLASTQPLHHQDSY